MAFGEHPAGGDPTPAFDAGQLAQKVGAELSELFHAGKPGEARDFGQQTPNEIVRASARRRVPGAGLNRRARAGAVGALAAAGFAGVALGSLLPGALSRISAPRQTIEHSVAVRPAPAPAPAPAVDAPGPQLMSLLTTAIPEPLPAQPAAQAGQPPRPAAAARPSPAPRPAPAIRLASAARPDAARRAPPAAAARIAVAPAQPTARPAPPALEPLARAPDPEDARRDDEAACGLGSDEGDACSAHELFVADEALGDMYRQARAAGVPASVLRADRQAWREVRERAARRSDQALLAAYRARMDNVQALIEQAWALDEDEAYAEDRYGAR